MNAVATKARRRNVYVSKHASGYTLTDTTVRPAMTADIINLGSKGWACRIDRCGKPYRYMVVTGTDNPHSIYELCRELGQRYTLNDNGQWEVVA